MEAPGVEIGVGGGVGGVVVGLVAAVLEDGSGALVHKFALGVDFLV